MKSELEKNLAENKLILLYTLSKLDLPISNQQLNKFILNNKFMNYFAMQEYLNELCEDGFISLQVYEGKNCYMLLKKGFQILEYFNGHIPNTVKEQIDFSIPKMKKSIQMDLFINSNIIKNTENDYIVECKIKEEQFDLIDLNIHVGNKSNANSICINWKKHAETIYNEIIDVLTKKRS